MKTKDGGVSGEAKETCGGKFEEDFAALQSCLLGGNPEQTGGERKLRRRSLILSTLIQVAVLLLVIAIPFFSKAERIKVKDFMPIPPYHSIGDTARQHTVAHLPPSGQRRSFCIMCPPARPTNPASLASHGGPVGADEPVIGSTSDEAETACSSCIPIGNGPKGPEIVTEVPSVVRMTHIDPAMLVERIEPAYPALARQTRREGRVELHAIISADGRIERWRS